MIESKIATGIQLSHDPPAKGRGTQGTHWKHTQKTACCSPLEGQRMFTYYDVYLFIETEIQYCCLQWVGG